MDYITKEADGQLAFAQSTDFLMIPSCLYGFKDTSTTTEWAKLGRTVHCFHGTLTPSKEESVCSCGCKMHINNHASVNLRHLPFGAFSFLSILCNEIS